MNRHMEFLLQLRAEACTLITRNAAVGTDDDAFPVIHLARGGNRDPLGLLTHFPEKGLRLPKHSRQNRRRVSVKIHRRFPAGQDGPLPSHRRQLRRRSTDINPQNHEFIPFFLLITAR